MNRNHLFVFIAAAALLGSLAFAGWSFFEIYPVTENLPPSREARLNNYLALDRWLTGMGCRIRTEQSGDLSLVSQAEEKQIFIQASLFRWNDEAAAYFLKWVEEGGNLFLILDDFREEDYWEDEEPLGLLEKFGIQVKRDSGSLFYDRESPDYDDYIYFELIENDETLLLKNSGGLNKVARVKHGKGNLTVTGRPYFLQSRYIGSAHNARIAWGLFAPPRDGTRSYGNDSFLFIRGTTRVRGLLGSLFRQGNLTVLVTAFLVLLVVCFWSAIPRFGLVRSDEERPGKTLRERFLAEGRFLKRYGALNFYRDVYIKEIKRQVARKEGISGDEEICGRVIEQWKKREGQKESRTLQKIFYGGPFSYREFPKIIFILKTILERI